MRETETSYLTGRFPSDWSTQSQSAEERHHFSEEQYYAVAGPDEPIRRFRVLLRTGASYSIPYALLPTFILEGNEHLVVTAHDLFVSIQGRNLEPVEEALTSESLLWLKESPSGKDTGESSVFIADISVMGKGVSTEFTGD